MGVSKRFGKTNCQKHVHNIIDHTLQSTMKKIISDYCGLFLKNDQCRDKIFLFDCMVFFSAKYINIFHSIKNGGGTNATQQCW